MQVEDFNFYLPDELIAQYPLKTRSGSRLLCLNKSNETISHNNIKNFPDLLNKNDLLVLNDTRVMKARLFANKITGGKINILVERILSDKKLLAHVGSNKPLKIGTRLILKDFGSLLIIDRDDNLFILELESELSIDNLLEQIGHIPLPPYIKRNDQNLDHERYQTVFSRELGAVAAPTAGLHFDKDLLKTIADKGVNISFLTLHVGAGTFKPITAETILDHKMHKERVNVPKETLEQIKKTKENGGRIIAVGTTVVRSLESAAQNEEHEKNGYNGETDIFIYPGYKFKYVDALLTNFHLPKSTLIMLVSAFAGCGFTKFAYEEAVKQKYRFFSYGDAMFITN